ncbi:MAG: hypothetical protein ACE5E5_12035, partial [Phycisphaerae bacterium]
MDTAFLLAQVSSSVPPWVLTVIFGSLATIVGLLGGFLLNRWVGRAKLEAARLEAERLVADAKTEADVLRK